MEKHIRCRAELVLTLETLRVGGFRKQFATGISEEQCSNSIDIDFQPGHEYLTYHEQLVLSQSNSIDIDVLVDIFYRHLFRLCLRAFA